MTDVLDLDAYRERRKQGIYVVDAGHKFIVVGPPIVTVRGAVDFRNVGERGRLDATYDFSKLDPKLHAAALNIIQQYRMNYYWITPDPDPKPKRTWWQWLWKPTTGK